MHWVAPVTFYFEILSVAKYDNDLLPLGRAFDWSIAKAVQEKNPIFVAGGLSPQNVNSAVSCATPLGVDVTPLPVFKYL